MNAGVTGAPDEGATIAPAASRFSACSASASSCIPSASALPAALSACPYTTPCACSLPCSLAKLSSKTDTGGDVVITAGHSFPKTGGAVSIASTVEIIVNGNTNQKTNQLLDIYYFRTKSVQAITPMIGSETGGTVVTVQGTHFDEDAKLICIFGQVVIITLLASPDKVVLRVPLSTPP